MAAGVQLERELTLPVPARVQVTAWLDSLGGDAWVALSRSGEMDKTDLDTFVFFPGRGDRYEYLMTYKLVAGAGAMLVEMKNFKRREVKR